MLASVLLLSMHRAEAQPVVSPASISVKNYTASGNYSNTMGLEYRTGNYLVNWTAGQGGVSTAYELHAVPTYAWSNSMPYVVYQPWNMDFRDSLTVWPPTGTGTNATITGFLAVDPQTPTAITNVYQVNAPYGSWPPYYSVTNIIGLPPRQNVTNITTGWEQPVLLPLWPHYTDIVTSYSMLGGGQTGIATNSANVSVDLYTGTSYNTAVLGQLNKFTLLSVGAYGVKNNSFSVPTIGWV